MTEKIEHEELIFAGRCCPNGWEIVPTEALEFLRKNYPEVWQSFYRKIALYYLDNVYKRE